jgi:1-acyl-sn-glycerol-3-phosphate acyltransferase
MVVIDAPLWLRLIRILAIATHLALGLLEVAITFPRRARPSRVSRINQWSKRLLAIIGIQIRVSGTPPSALYPPNSLVVANHISWIDIFVMDTVVVSRFVAKSEVRQWPLIGWLCAHTGTLFVERDKRRDAARVNREIAEALASGDCVGIYPEGSTTDGCDVKPFNPSLLQPAIDAKAKVIPVALRYLLSDGRPAITAAYIGDMTLWDSIWQLVSARHMVVELVFFPALASQNYDRRSLALHLQNTIGSVVRGESVVKPNDSL